MVTQRDRDNRTERQQLMRPASRQLIGVPDSRPQPPAEFIPREFLPALRAATRAEPQAVAPQAAESQAAPQAEPQAAAQQDAGVTPSATSARYDPNNPYVAEAMRLEEKYNLPKGVFLALVQQESGFKPNAVSKAGAIGLAQLMPGTASGLNVDPRDPMQNLDGGARYLAEQIATFGDLSKGLAAYNAGPGAVRKAGNAIPNFPETQKYVAAVMRNAGYPMAPPKLADGGLIELARKYADGGSVAGAAQVYDPAVIAAIAASITEPQGYAEGGQVDVAPTSSVWDRYLPRDLPDSAYGDLQQNLKYLPLNIKRLLDAGAIRITQPGSGDESNPHAINSSDPEKWSLVTAHNDRNSDSYTRGWASKPESYESAIKILNDPGALYDGKYRQILWSARKLGLRPDEVFMPKEEARSPAASGRGYADGGTTTGVSSDDAAPRTFADLVGRYGVGDAMQMAAPLDDPSLGAGVSQSIGDYFRPIVQGNFEIPGTVKKYAIDVATGPKPFTRLGKDIGTFGSAIWEGVKNDPVGTALDFVPVVSNVRSAMDMHESRNRAVEAEQAGDEDRGSMYRQFSALGAAGAIPLVGYGAIAARRAANAARDAAARRAGAAGAKDAGTALVVRGGVDDIGGGVDEIGGGGGVGLIAREDAAARGTQAIARDVVEDVSSGTDVVAREGVGLEPSGSVARRAKAAAARESAQAVAVVPRNLSPSGFYSLGEETAANLAQAKGTPQQFRGLLEKYGVKPVELEGFDEAFAGRPSVTREELAKHFSERRPQVEETVLGTPRPEQMKMMRDEYARAEYGEDFSGLASEYKRRIDDLIMNHETTTRFQQYTLPGGENYREIALTLPGEEIYRVPASHSMGEKADVNRIAHIRMSDRTGPNGEKILHLEELQSDWGQKGRTEGFADPKVAAQWEIDKAAVDKEFREAEKQYKDLVDRMQSLGGEPLEPFKRGVESPRAFEIRQAEHFNKRDALLFFDPDYRASRQRLWAARDASWALGSRLTNSGIPTAPYVTNTAAWTDLALKRALKEAAEGGYDKIVWTPGAEQAKRYDLSKYVDKIAYDPEQKGFHYKAKGADDWSSYDKLVSPEELNSIIGKETADKLLAQKADEDGVHFLLNIKDISLGGEGMKAYYDKMVPNQLSKLVKRLDPDAKVGLTDVMLPQGTGPGMGHNNPPFEAPGLTITPKMREAIMKGQTDFAEGGHVQGYADGGSADNSLAALYEKYYGEPTTRISYAQGGSVDDNASVLTSPDGDLIIVGIKHGEMPRLPRELRNNIRAAGNRHGFYYEGDGGDRAAVGRAFGEIDYKGSLDDGLDVPEERRPDFLYTLFSSNASKTPNLLNRLVDKDKTILESLYENKNTISHNSVRGKLRRNDIVQFLNKTEMRDYSMRPATRRNIKAFLERGEAQMWPDNWQDFPNPAGAVARDALELRLQAVIQRGSGVYFLGVDNLPILHGLAPRLQAKAPKTQAPAEEQTDYAQGGSVDSAPVYDPAVIAAIAASITEDNYA